MPKVVMFDVDGVLASFLTGFTKKLREYTGDTPILSHDRSSPGATQTHSWDFDPAVFPPKLVDKVWQDIKAGPNFWLSLEPLQTFNTMFRIGDLQKRYDVYFVTSRPGIGAKLATELWLASFTIPTPTVIMSSLKGECAKAIGAGYSIEDKAENAVMIKCWAPKCHSYILDYPYNRWDQTVLGSGVRRVNTVEEFLADVEAGR